MMENTRRGPQDKFAHEANLVDYTGDIMVLWPSPYTLRDPGRVINESLSRGRTTDGHRSISLYIRRPNHALHYR